MLKLPSTAPSHLSDHPDAQGSKPATRDPYTGVDYNFGFTLTHYDLDLTYRVEPNLLSGTATLTITTDPREEISQLTLDLAGNLVARRVTAQAAPRIVKHRQSGGKLRVTFAQPLAPATTFQLTIRYGGNPRPLHTPWGLIGWEETESGSLVASQPNGAPSWFPCDDTPSQKATFDLTITADNPFTVIASGQLVDKKSAGSASTRWHYRADSPLATYLATVQVGEFIQVPLGPTTAAWAPAHLRPAVADEFAQQQQMLDFFSATFGDYPFPDYRVVVTADELEIPLEAQGVSIFGANHITGNHTFERLIAHELAHQWFGNSTGLRHWGDIWLNEGFACYAEWLWAEHASARSAHDIARSHYSVLARKRQDVLLRDPGTRDMFDDRVYKRGALAVHAMRRLLGDAPFFHAIRSYLAAARHSTVTPADLFAQFHAVADAAGTTRADIDALLSAWLDSPVLPKFPA